MTMFKKTLTIEKYCYKQLLKLWDLAYNYNLWKEATLHLMT